MPTERYADERRASSDGEDADRKARKSGCGCPTGCMIAIAILFFLACLPVVLAPRIARHFMRKHASPAAITAMDAARVDPIVFPAEWQNAPRIDIKMVSEYVMMDDAIPTTASSLLYDSSVTLALKKCRGRIPVTADEMSSVTRIADAHKAYLATFDKFSTGSQHFGISAVGEMEFGFFPIFMGRRYGSWTWTWRIFPLAAYAKATTGDWPDALRILGMRIRQMRTTPLGMSSLYVKSQSMEQFGEVCLDIAVLARQCPDPKPIEVMLRELDELRAHLIVPPSGLPAWLLQHLYSLQTARRLGYESDMTPGRPGIYYAQELVRVGFELPKFLFDKTPAGDPLRDQLQEAMLAHGSGSGASSFARALFRFSANMLPDFLVLISVEQLGTETQEVARNRFIARYDLLRIELAARLHELETGSKPTSVSQLVGTRLVEEPLDPFTKQPFLYDAAKAQFYSAGPDKIDAHGATGESTSAGSGDDVILIPEMAIPAETSGTETMSEEIPI